MTITEADIEHADEGGSYSWRKFVTSSPAALKATFLVVASTVVVILEVQGVTTNGAIVASVGVSIEQILERFYVRPKQALQQEIQTLRAMDLGQQTAQRSQLRAEDK